MGRTINNYDDDDRRKNKPAKHSKNIPGKGMRVINNWSEEYDDIDLEEDDYLPEYDDEYYENITQTQRK